MFSAAVSVFPRPLAHPDKLEVAPVPGQLRQSLAALELQRLIPPDPAVLGAQELGGLHRRPVAGPREARGHEALLPGPGPTHRQAVKLLEELGPVGGGAAAVQDPHLEHAVDDAQLLAVVDVPGGDGELPGQSPGGVAVQGELAHARLDKVVNTLARLLLLVAEVEEY